MNVSAITAWTVLHFPHTLTVGKKEVFVPAPIDAEFKLAEGIDPTLRVGKIAGVVERAYLRRSRRRSRCTILLGMSSFGPPRPEGSKELTRPMSPLYARGPSPRWEHIPTSPLGN